MAKIVCLHDYQEDIIQRLSEEWRTRCSVMVQMPTGTGKTHVLAAVVSSFLTDGKRTVWIVAHRRGTCGTDRRDRCKNTEQV